VDVERSFLSKIIHDEVTNVAINSRITAAFFTDPQWKRIYSFLMDHFRAYGKNADEAIIQTNFPSLTWPPQTQPIEYLIDALRERRKKALFLDGLNRAAQHVSFKDPDDTKAILDIITQTLLSVRVETAPAMDMEVSTLYSDAILGLDERIDDPGILRGISSGFDGIDYVTRGFQPEQFVVIIGLPKSLKSSLLLYMCLKAQEQAKSAVFLGFEMSNQEQGDRMSSLLGKVSLTKILHGTVTDREYRAIDAGWKERARMRDIVFSTDMENAMTVAGVAGKVMDYQPDVVFIDAAYLMQSEIPKVEPGSAQALTDIARELKKLAQSQKVPIVVTTQASQTRSKGGRLNAESAMYTQAWRQSADVMLGIERVDPEADDAGEVALRLKVLSSRSGPRAETALVWDWNKGSVFEIGARAVPAEDDDDA
jgi:replicative DNA helicase